MVGSPVVPPARRLAAPPRRSHGGRQPRPARELFGARLRVIRSDAEPCGRTARHRSLHTRRKIPRAGADASRRRAPRPTPPACRRRPARRRRRPAPRRPARRRRRAARARRRRGERAERGHQRPRDQHGVAAPPARDGGHRQRARPFRAEHADEPVEERAGDGGMSASSTRAAARSSGQRGEARLERGRQAIGEGGVVDQRNVEPVEDLRGRAARWPVTTRTGGRRRRARLRPRAAPSARRRPVRSA